MPPRKQQSLDAFFGNSTKRNASCSTSKRARRRSSDGSAFGDCPLCGISFPLHQLEVHASTCTGEVPSDREVSTKNAANGTSRVSILPHTSQPIPGLFLFEDFITDEEEKILLAQLDGQGDAHKHEFLPWKEARFNGIHLGKRWGVHCNLRDRRVSAPEHELPHFFHNMLQSKLQQVRPMMGCQPNEANAIDYRKSQGHYLKSHVDDRQLSREPIANLSLAGDCYMTFSNVAPHRNALEKETKVLLKRKCLQVLTGTARYDFAHGISNADLPSERRVSVTMRESPLTKKLSLASQLRWKTPEPLRIQDAIHPSSEPIPGLFVFEDFITEEEERIILEQLDTDRDQPWKTESHTGMHREKRFGMDHDLWSRQVRAPKHALPNFMSAILIPKLKRIVAMAGCVPNDVNAIDYRREAGHALGSHVDDRKKHKEPIANLSLAGDCYMTYRNQAPNRNVAVQEQKVLLRRRTLQIMTGTARYDFAHGISNRDLLSKRRVSVTMRETIST